MDMLQPKNKRKALLKIIKDYASDEIEDVSHVWKLAEESEAQLVKRIEHIIGYYENNYLYRDNPSFVKEELKVAKQIKNKLNKIYGNKKFNNSKIK